MLLRDKNAENHPIITPFSRLISILLGRDVGIIEIIK